MSSTLTGSQNAILVELTDQIMINLRRQKSEERHPSFDADKMDDVIKFHSEQAHTLRLIREELEDAFAQAAP